MTTCPRCDVPTAEADLKQFGGLCAACLLQFSKGQDVPAFPDLEILETLGEGGMGVVYKARQNSLDRTVALKVLTPALSCDPSFVERFDREAKALAALDHPNVVKVFGGGVHDGVPYLVMEHVEGTSLRALLAAGKLPPARALAIIPQICDALAYAHGRGVVHRDIKPENVLVDGAGWVKIADFGLAKVTEPGTPQLTRTNAVLGTPNYMAPEQVERPQAVDHRADIYSLGVVFYEMLTGELPLGRFKAPSETADVDRRLDPVVLRSLEKAPGDRWQSAEEVKARVAGLGAAPFPALGSWWTAAGLLGIAGIWISAQSLRGDMKPLGAVLLPPVGLAGVVLWFKMRARGASPLLFVALMSLLLGLAAIPLHWGAWPADETWYLGIPFAIAAGLFGLEWRVARTQAASIKLVVLLVFAILTGLGAVLGSLVEGERQRLRRREEARREQERQRRWQEELRGSFAGWWSDSPPLPDGLTLARRLSGLDAIVAAKLPLELLKDVNDVRYDLLSPGDAEVLLLFFKGLPAADLWRDHPSLQIGADRWSHERWQGASRLILVGRGQYPGDAPTLRDLEKRFQE